MHLCLFHPRLKLQPRLLSYSFVAFSRAVQWLVLQRNGQSREFRQSFSLPAIQLFALEPRYAGYQGKMIVAAPLCIALAKPTAYIAMCAGLRITFQLLHTIAGTFEPRFYISVVSGIFCNAIGLRFEILARWNHVHKVRRLSLNLAQQRGI